PGDARENSGSRSRLKREFCNGASRSNAADLAANGLGKPQIPIRSAGDSDRSDGRRELRDCAGRGDAADLVGLCVPQVAVGSAGDGKEVTLRRGEGKLGNHARRRDTSYLKARKANTELRKPQVAVCPAGNQGGGNAGSWEWKLRDDPRLANSTDFV